MPTPPAPDGADASSRLLEATRSLLAERRPAEITVRTIAERAGVQHSLITRHFGSRDALIGAAVGSVLRERAEAVRAAPDVDAAIDATVDAFVGSPGVSTALGVLISEGMTPPGGDNPIVDALTASLVRAGIDPSGARETALLVVLVASSWAAGERWWLQVADIPDAADGRRLVARAARSIVDGAAGRSVSRPSPPSGAR